MGIAAFWHETDKRSESFLHLLPGFQDKRLDPTKDFEFHVHYCVAQNSSGNLLIILQKMITKTGVRINWNNTSGTLWSSAFPLWSVVYPCAHNTTLSVNEHAILRYYSSVIPGETS